MKVPVYEFPAQITPTYSYIYIKIYMLAIFYTVIVQKKVEAILEHLRSVGSYCKKQPKREGTQSKGKGHKS